MNLCFRTVPNSAIPSSAKRYKKTIYGIFGLISLSQCRSQPIRNFVLTRHLLSAEYLIVITSRELRGHLLGHPIYRAVDFDILPIRPGLSATKPSHPVETHLLALVRSHLSTSLFLYSYVFDITRRLQAQYVARESDEGKPMWEMVRVAYQGQCLFSQPRRLGRRQVLLEQVRWCHGSGLQFVDFSFRFLQSRFMDISISDPKNDVSRRAAVARVS